MENTWFELPGYEDKYQISNNKEIRIKSRDILDSDGTVLKHLDSIPVPIKKDSMNNLDYVVLHNGSKYVKVYIDDLVSLVNF